MWYRNPGSTVRVSRNMVRYLGYQFVIARRTRGALFVDLSEKTTYHFVQQRFSRGANSFVSIEESFHDRADHFALPCHRKDRRRRHGRGLGGRRYAVGPPSRAEIFARRARTGCFGARAAEARS